VQLDEEEVHDGPNFQLLHVFEIRGITATVCRVSARLDVRILKISQCHSLSVDNRRIFWILDTVKNGYKHITVRFGLAIKYLRLRQELTQEELAHRAVLHRTYLTDIERGTRNPSIEVIEKLANGLGISLTELFRLAESVTPTSKFASLRK